LSLLKLWGFRQREEDIKENEILIDIRRMKKLMW